MRERQGARQRTTGEHSREEYAPRTEHERWIIGRAVLADKGSLDLDWLRIAVPAKGLSGRDRCGRDSARAVRRVIGGMVQRRSEGATRRKPC